MGNDFAEIRIMRKKMKQMSEQQTGLGSEDSKSIVTALQAISDTLVRIENKLGEQPLIQKQIITEKLVSDIPQEKAKAKIDFQDKEFIPDVNIGHSNVRVKDVKTKKTSVSKDTSAFDAILGDK